MRWIIRIGVALSIVIIAAVAVLLLLPAERIARLVTDQFEAATGRAMVLEGDVRPTLWPEFGVNTGAVRIANADWSDAGPMVQAEGLSIGVDLASVLGRKIRVTRIEVDRPQILLELARDGRANWDMWADADTGGAATAAEAAPASGSDDVAGEAWGLYGLDHATVSDGTFTFVDHATGSRTQVDSVDASLRLPDFDGAADLEATLAMNGQPLSVNARIDGFTAFLAEGAVPVSMQGNIGGSSIGFDGRAGVSPMGAAGQIEADLADRTALFALIGQPAPEVPLGLGQKISVAGDLTLTDRSLALREATVRLDHNVLVGAVDIALGERPRVTAKLGGADLDFSALMGEEVPTETGGASGGGTAAVTAVEWPRDHIDVSALHLVDADVALSASSLDMGIAKLGATRVVIALERGRAVTDIREMNAYGGNLDGSVVVNARGGLSARANLRGAGVALQPLLQELAGYDRLIGTGDLTVNLLGVGNDLATLMASLEGDAALNLGQGELRGLDLVGMLRNLDPGYVGEGSKTIFDGVSASFAVDKGVARNSDLQLRAPLLTATGQGEIDIGAMTLDYRVVPALLEGQTNGGLKVPLMITGPWTAPKFRLDLAALAEQELADDVEKLKVQAEEVVKDKIESELGVKVDDLGDVEDVLKRELEERAKKGLLDLLGGN